MPDIGIVDLRMQILERLSKVFQDPATSDVTFLIGGIKLPAHRLPLAAQSGVFQILLYGDGYLESNQREIRLEVPLNAMKMLLAFAYTGKIDLRGYPLPEVADLMELSRRYGFEELEKLIAQYLCIAVNAENVCLVLNVAWLVDCVPLIERCWMIVEMIVEGIYNVDLDLTYKRLMELLNRKPRKISEVKLFQFAHKLAQKTKFCTKKEKTAIFSKIDFSMMSVEKLYGIVEPTGVLSKAALCDIIKKFSLYKAERLYKNVSEIATVLVGKNTEFLFQTNKGFTIPDKEENFIMVDLNSLYLINFIKFVLKLGKNSGYYIEVSTTKNTWLRVVDPTGHFKENLELYFAEVIARFIKIVPVNGVIECNSLQIGHVENPPQSLGGFVFPAENIAVNEKAGAFTRKPPDPFMLNLFLLNGVFDDKVKPFTAHKLNIGNIQVGLGQPYILSSCRFLLWDQDDRKYSYVVKVASTASEKSTVISNKSDELLNGWQTINFAPRPVQYFIIIGHRATVGDEIRLVHFEAPAKTEIILKDGQKKIKL